MNTRIDVQALAHLCQLADAHKAAKHPAFPYPVKSKYSDRDANGLTKCVVDYCNLSGHFATRLASTGTFRADLQKFVASQQRAGLPDILAVVEGRAVFVEVKAGKDQLSEKQKDTIRALEKSGASVYVAHSFAGFLDWFTAEFLTPPFA